MCRDSEMHVLHRVGDVQGQRDACAAQGRGCAGTERFMCCTG
jgi:hypothetical protein